jgi:serine protease Do
MGRVFLRFLSWVLAGTVVSVTAGAESRAVGFTKLVIRLPDDDIGFAGGNYRVNVLETLRGGQVNAVGAENLVFEKDEAGRAELLLGGTAKELVCEEKVRAVSCRLGIEWQLLDVETDQIVYQVMLRSVARDVSVDVTKGLGMRLVKRQVEALLARPKFRAALNQPTAVPSATRYPVSGFLPCAAPASAMPDGFQTAAAATVVVRTAQGFGSGFFLGPTGLVLTAAHAVKGPELKLELFDGTELAARPVRLSKLHDAALLVVKGTTGPFPCLPIETGPKAIGRDVYAIGAPASKQLAFSLTRGIVSAQRSIDGTTLLQTDTAMSPGNSGGPLVDADGRIVAVVSRKFAGRGIEGVGFGVPIEVALQALGLTQAGATAPELLGAATLGFDAPSASPLVVDAEDPVPSLDPARDAAMKSAAEEREERKWVERATPAYVPLLRWGGLIVASGGLLAAYGTTRSVDQGNMTRDEFETIRLYNDLSWVAAGAGAVAFGASFLLVPSAPKKKSTLLRQVALEAEGRGARLRVSY